VAEIVVLCPSRGRPSQAVQMVKSLRETAVLFATQVILVVDRDDPELDDYLRIPAQFTEAAGGRPLRPPDRPSVMVLDESETGDLVRATNTAARRVWDDDVIIGHLGDDHRFRTPGWDKAISGALAEPGIAYGDDGYWGSRLCTAWFVSASLPRALGWLALPTSSHYAIDDAWRDLGQAIDRLHYLPDVCIVQPPPSERPRGPSRKADQAAYRAWISEARDRDAETLAGVIRQAVAA
jgi:hypothetical protein